MNLQGAIDSMDKSVLLTTLAHQGMPQKFVNIIHHRLLLPSTNFQLKRTHRVTWRSPATRQS
ncbi:hypothetical protein T265_11919 [Opisthorchis viverrini]|uniref:Uncharacterized protein n=1 Tax=Opisthorchis viverrini TaxID=6198 RepID=A0A074Z7P8_OPIVI|nr:hypothetical protein T265_11919 [Opisthorchis viverrini]KER19245.1 hypothetical protein T265_11919 [Opisthorchis viverrini]